MESILIITSAVRYTAGDPLRFSLASVSSLHCMYRPTEMVEYRGSASIIQKDTLSEECEPILTHTADVLE